MWQDILNIHQDCKEEFFNFEQLPGNVNSLIAYAGISTLRTKYQIGKIGTSNVLDKNNQKNIHVHYLLSTNAGEGKISFNNTEHNIKPGSIVLIPAGTPFLYELAGDYWDMCWLMLHDCPQYNYIHQLNPDVFISSDANRLYQTMSLIKEFNHSNGRFESDIILRLVEVLLYQIEETLNENSNLSEQQLKFHLLMRSVKKQLQLPWSVSTLAAKMHMSEPQFYRMCRKETAMTPIKYITLFRLEYACYLLRYTNYNLEQIAFSIGYADSASFAHRFKKNYQLSPGRWRVSTENQFLSTT